MPIRVQLGGGGGGGGGGGIIPHFYRFLGILKFWGYVQVLPIFQMFMIFQTWGFNKNLLTLLK